MKKMFMVLMGIATLVFGVFIAIDSQGKQRCDLWLNDARLHDTSNRHARVIDKLTLYFESEDCRSKNDAGAVHLLAKSRKMVPLPLNAHLGQEILLAKHGLQLGENASSQLETASAHLAHSRWEQARQAARQLDTAQASMISLAASVALSEGAEVEHDFNTLIEGEASPFSVLLAHKLLQRRSFGRLDGGDHASAPAVGGADISRFESNEALLDFVNYIIAPDDDYNILPAAMRVAGALSDKDLATASSLLTAKGKLVVATLILDQQSRPLAPALLVRLARLFWVQGDLKALDKLFLTRKIAGIWPAEVLLAVCIAQRKLHQICDVDFDRDLYEERYGAYVATKWSAVLTGLSAERLDVVPLINALNDMGHLVAGNGLALQLKASLLFRIGENKLAQKYSQAAALLGYAGIVALEAPISQRKLPCKPDETQCIADVLNMNGGEFDLWRQALAVGFKPDSQLAQQLRAKSPEEAILWRIVSAQALIREGDDESMAEALILLRPVLAWVPIHATAQLLVAVCYFHFEDMEAVLLALSSAVKHNPNRAVEALRLALGFYEAGNTIAASQLAHWWQGVTLLEIEARGLVSANVDGEKLLQERLSLLAAYAEEKKDADLSIVTYETLLRLNPNNHMALNNLAYHLVNKEGQSQRALKLAAQAIRLNPMSAEYRRTFKTVRHEFAPVEP